MTIKEIKIQLALGTLSKEDKIKLADGRKVSKKILTMLSKDKDYIVRSWVAWNPNTPVEVLKELSKDKDEYVRQYVARNPNTPKDIKENMEEKQLNG